jgi:hypothetical protein
VLSRAPSRARCGLYMQLLLRRLVASVRSYILHIVCCNASEHTSLLGECWKVALRLVPCSGNSHMLYHVTQPNLYVNVFCSTLQSIHFLHIISQHKTIFFYSFVHNSKTQPNLTRVGSFFSFNLELLNKLFILISSFLVIKI